MGDDSTNVQVSNDTWRRLTLRKEPGDTYDDVIKDLLDKVEELEED